MKAKLRMVVTGLLLACSGVPAAALAGAQGGREVLPTDVTPLHYELAITPDAAQLVFRGSVRIDLRVLRPTRSITLNAADLKVERAQLDGRTHAPRILADERRQRLTLEFDQPIAPGRHALTIDYRGTIYRQGTGLFALDYETAAGRQRSLFTKFEPATARRFLPCWDEPAAKATYTLTVTIPAGQMAVSNMPVAQAVDAGNGLQRVRFETTPKMSSYLLFFGAGDFERVHRQVGNVDLGAIVRRGSAEQANYALDVAAQVLPFYNDFFGMPYPLPKLDLIAGPGSSTSFAAMENWGAIFYFEKYLLVDPRYATEADRRAVYISTVHEIAHQWFGNLVTMNWWDDLWLNEGFAEWLQNTAAEQFHPEWQVWADAGGRRQAAMRTDAALGTHPVITPIRDVLAAGQAFDEITYDKGAAVIRMLETHAGPAHFRDGVRRYMRAHAYGDAVTDDLWRAVDAAGGAPITTIAHEFTLQSGVPLVSVRSLGCGKDHQLLAFSQGRLASDESGRRGARLWHVPVSVRSVATGEEQHLVVSGAAPQTLTVNGCGAVLLNAGQTGYYHTLYLGEAHDALAAQFTTLAAGDQRGLLADSWALAQAGTVPLADFLDLAARLDASADPLAWRSVVERLGALDRLYDGLPGQVAFRIHAVQSLAPLYARLGWDAAPGEDGNTALLRQGLLRVLGNMADPDVLAEARRRFAQLLENRQALNAATRSSVLDSVARNATVAEWEQILALARTSTDPGERREYYILLGLASDPALSQRALDLAISDEVPVTIRPLLLQSVGRSGSGAGPGVRGTDRATRFAIEHWAVIQPWLDDRALPNFVPRLAAESFEPATIDALDTYAAAHIAPAARSTLAKTEAQIRGNIAVRARLGEIDRWLAARALHGQGG